MILRESAAVMFLFKNSKGLHLFVFTEAKKVMLQEGITDVLAVGNFLRTKISADFMSQAKSSAVELDNCLLYTSPSPRD